MGFFDFLKKKQNQEQPQEPKQPEIVIAELEAAEDFGTIAKVLTESNLISMPKDENHNTFGQDINCLDEDGELPWGWAHYNSDFIERQEKKIDKKWEAVYTCKSTSDKLEAYKKYFDTITKIGALCKKTGECHYKWFCENVIESQWYNDQLEKYEQFKVNAPDLIKHEKLLETLEADIMAKLAECDGIVQSDFIKTFDPLLKNDISSFLYQAEKYGKITRTKSGRSYILHLN